MDIMYPQLRWVAVVVVGLVAGGRDAHAQSIEIIEPSPPQSLDLGPVNLGATSATRRIIFRNNGTASPRLVEIFIDNPEFAIVGSGGDLEPGHTAYWDIAVSPVERSMCSGNFDFRYRANVDDDFVRSVSMFCTSRNVPFDANPLNFGGVGPMTITRQRLTVTNTGATSREIVAITSNDAAVSVKLVESQLPLVLGPEAAVELEVTFAPTEPRVFHETPIAFTMADGTSQSVTQLIGLTSDNAVFSIGNIDTKTPRGAAWRHYGRLANYSSQPLVVSQIASTHADVTLVGIAAGEAVPPHTEIPVLAQVTPSADGPISAEITLSLDSAPPLTARVDAFGRTTVLEFITEDDVPGDGVLDFGTLSPSSPPVTRRVTIRNLGSAGRFIDYINFFSDQGFTAPLGSLLLQPGAAFDVDITFDPASPAPLLYDDRRTGGFRFTELGTDHFVLWLSAYVATHPVTLSTEQLTFADTVRSPAVPTSLELTLTNFGMTPMPVPAASVTGSGFRLESSPPSGVIAPLGTAIYRVAFEPTEVGAFDGVLTVEGFAEVPLHGNGIAGTQTGCSAGRNPASALLICGVALLLRRRRESEPGRAAIR
jgi:hypothetical protein